jgi:Cdc6-like AAA superfamily ATPase
LIVNIDKTKLSDAPYRSDRKNAFAFEDNELVEQIVLELTHGMPSSFLVSGYRGVGKTSFVNRVIEKLGAEFICVTINLAKYDGYPVLLKKMIRALYLAYEAREPSDSPKTKEGLQFDQEFKLLYDRTFHEVVRNHTLNTKKESKKGTEAEFDLKKVIPIVLTLLSTTSLTFNLIDYKILNYFVFILSLAWTCISVFKFNWSRSQDDLEIEETARKSLYDDNIAEHHLLTTLAQLQQQGIKVLIAFDELDKIEKTEEVLPVINDLKFLLLSGYASFFVIAGQGLYYQYERSGLLDDRVISTLFSKSIHIPFLKYAALKRYCLELVSDEGQRSDVLVNDHFDCLILASGRIPRKLVNLIRDQVRWKNAQAYLTLEEDQINLNKETRLLHALTRIMDNKLPDITTDQVRISFYIAQIYLWVIRMKQYNEARFQLSAVINEPAYQGKYPDTFIGPLWAVGELLMDELVKEAILKVYHPDDHEEESDYYWSFGIKNQSKDSSVPKDDHGNVQLPSIDPQFVIDFADLEALMREIYLDIEPSDTQRGKYSFPQLVNRLIDIGVLTKTWYSSNKVEELVSIRNKIVHGEGITQEEKKAVQNAAFTLNRLRAEVVDDFIFYITQRYLTAYNVKREQNEFDFTARRNGLVILFDVKYQQNDQDNERTQSELMDKLANAGFTQSNEMYFIRFVFRGNRRLPVDDLDSRSTTPVSNEYAEIKDRLAFFYLHGEQEGKLKEEIENCLGIALGRANLPLN